MSATTSSTKNPIQQHSPEMAAGIEAAHETARETFAKVKEIAQTASQKAKELEADFPSVIRRHPLAALALAFGIGVVSTVAISRSVLK